MAKTQGAPLAAVVMAGGFSRRLGENKLLRQFHGKPLYACLFDKLPMEYFSCIIVATRYEAIGLDSDNRGFFTVRLTAEDKTQGDTIRRSMERLRELGSFVGAGFFVCDQPFLTSESICRLAKAFLQQPQQIWALGAAGKKGNPVIFPACTFPSLEQLSSKETGSAVIAKYPSKLRILEADFPEELLDLDTEEAFDLAKKVKPSL